MISRTTILLVVFTVSSVLAWPYGEQPIRGVNAGGWLVLEKWMVPSSVFAGLPDSVQDEFGLCEYLNKTEAENRLRAHWNTWVTETDFALWARTGINHVRVPIGYWAIDIKPDEPWVSGSWEYVVKAAEWSKKYGLQLMIDLHGAPGSQNGWDHSGRSGAVEFFTDENINRTVNVIGEIARWSSLPEWKDTVSIIQLLNEPTLWGDDYQHKLNRLKDYYGLAYHEVRKHNDVVVVAVHDAFIDASNWYYFADLPEYHSVMLDMHLYQVFGDDWIKMTCTEHYEHPCTYNRVEEVNKKLWTVVAEWSLATPAELLCDKQKYFASQQIAAFEKGSGWFMWAHNNAQNMPEWSFKHSYENKWINPSEESVLYCSSTSIYSSLVLRLVSASALLLFLIRYAVLQ